MGKMIGKVSGALALLVVGYFVLRGLTSWAQGYSWDEVNWSQQGRTSMADLFAASDVGKKEVLVAGIKCVEYYAYKDGLSIKKVCPKGPT